jgi:RNA polymerase sigma-70 factor (ECF subfamily)
LGIYPGMAAQPRLDQSFDRMYRRHSAHVYRYAYGMLRNRADAEDVAQTTFLNAYRALERGEDPQSPHNWLIKIAHNVCLQRFRTAARRPQEVELDYDVADDLVADDRPAAEDIRRALGHLAFNQRAAIVLREIEGRSYAEIGEVLGLSMGAVETLVFRARRALREQLEGGLTCAEAELAISKQLDGALSRAEKSQLRAHLRECSECATLARSQRAQRAALKAFGGALPWWGGFGLVAKTAAVVVAAGAVGAGSVFLPPTWKKAAPSVNSSKAAQPVRKFSAGASSHSSGRALVPTLRGLAARGPRGVLDSGDRVASTNRKEVEHEHRQQAQRGHRLGRGQAGKARGQAQGSGSGADGTQGRRGGGSARGAGRAAGPQEEKAHGLGLSGRESVPPGHSGSHSVRAGQADRGSSAGAGPGASGQAGVERGPVSAVPDGDRGNSTGH